MKNYLIAYVSVAIAIVVVYKAGYNSAMAEGNRALALYKERQAKRTARLERDYRDKEKINAQKLSEVIEQLEKSKGYNVSLAIELDRLRNEAISLRSQLSTASDRAIELEKGLLEQGIELHERSAELIKRLTDVSTKCARQNQALIKLIDDEPDNQ